MSLDCALALGFFDGVHAGHRTVLAHARAWADEHGKSAYAVTFDRQPSAFVKGGREELLYTLEERKELLKKDGLMDGVIVLPFDEKLRNTPPENFIQDILINKFSPGFITAGFDYRFGIEGAGNAKLLKSLCARFGIDCVIAPRMDAFGEKCSSSSIRSMIAGGDIEKANGLLGRAFGFSGVVQHGKALGRTLGFPTMNVYLPDKLVCPRPGVYVCRALLRGQMHAGVCNISEERLCETFMLGHNEDAYGQEICIELLSFVRPMRSFNGLEQLKEQVDIDKKFAADWFIIRFGGLF